MNYQEAQEEYGTVSDILRRLIELNTVDDLRSSDIDEAMRDINFIRTTANLQPYDYQDVITLLI